MDQQYDISPEMQKLFHKKEEERMACKKYYQNLMSNPYRSLYDGVPAEPNMFRYHAMSMYHAEIWKPSTKSKLFCVAYLAPFFLFYYYMKNTKQETEKSIRSGVLNITNRPFMRSY